MKYEAGNRFNPDTYFKTEVDSTSVTVKVTGDLEGVEVSFDSGDVPEITSLSVTENGTYEAPEGTAYDQVTVEVSNTYTESDEGKVVSSGALVSQTSTTKTANGTYDTTTNNEVVVAVPGPSGSINITQNGTVDVTNYASAVVNVSGGSDYELVAEGDMQCSTTSATEISLGTFQAGANAFSSDLLLIEITDKAGPRTGYFYKSLSLVTNSNPLSNPGLYFAKIVHNTIYKDTDDKWQGGNSSYGVFPKTILTNGAIDICGRYASYDGGTIDGTYHIAVYKLKMPDGSSSPFVVTP